MTPLPLPPFAGGPVCLTDGPEVDRPASRMVPYHGQDWHHQRAGVTVDLPDYFLEGSKYGFSPESWSVVSMTCSISGAACLIATSIPCFSVTLASPQP